MSDEPLDMRRLNVPRYDRVMEYGPRRWELVKKTIGDTGGYWSCKDERVSMTLDAAYEAARAGSQALPATEEGIELYAVGCKIVRRATSKYNRILNKSERENGRYVTSYREADWAAKKADDAAKYAEWKKD